MNAVTIIPTRLGVAWFVGTDLASVLPLLSLGIRGKNTIPKSPHYSSCQYTLTLSLNDAIVETTAGEGQCEM